MDKGSRDAVLPCAGRHGSSGPMLTRGREFGYEIMKSSCGLRPTRGSHHHRQICSYYVHFLQHFKHPVHVPVKPHLTESGVNLIQKVCCQ